MEATVFPLAYATLELLDLYNYDDWSLKVKNYLVGEGLWDVANATATTPSNDEAGYMNWRMKNSKALYAIQISCRTDVLGFIGDIENAKDAWEMLAKRLKPKNRSRGSDIKGKSATLVPSVMFDLGALDKDNYADWSFWVKRYLFVENLWEVVEGSREPPKHEDREAIIMERKNNAMALHIIILFCGEDAESCIRESKTAKDAWSTLADKFSTPETFETLEVHTEVDPSDDDASSNDGNTDLIMEDISIEDANDLKGMVRNSEWTRLREFVKQHRDAVRVILDMELTLLQLAIIYKKVEGVKELVNLMEKKDFDVVGYDGHTALSLAILNGLDTDEGIEMVKCIVEKNKKLLYRVVRPPAHTIPLLYALTLDRPKTADYLYSVTPISYLRKMKTNDAAEVISICLRLKHLDLALKLLQRFPKLILTKDHSSGTPLNELAGTRAGLFPNVRQLGIWKRLLYQWIHIPELSAPSDLQNVSITISQEDNNEGNRNLLIRKVNFFFSMLLKWMCSLTGFDSIYQMKLLHSRTQAILRTIRTIPDLNRTSQELVGKALFQAVERGHIDIIQHIYACQWCTLSWLHALRNENNKSLLHFATELRQDEIFDFLSTSRYGKIESQESIGRIDKFGSNMLHVVGKLSPLTRIGHIRGAALQMQYELQWFKKVEKLASPKDLTCINFDGRTPREEFTFNHRDLVEAGEKSMKETATSSSALVAALIITIMFAAAVTVPGGIDGNSGIPIYLHNKAFRIFMVADAISLCSATTSVMVFLGILTSRFAEADFLTSLPTKLIIGFLTLFLSVGSMMVAFSAAVYIMLPEEPTIVIASMVLAGIPIASFLWMQFPFLIEVIISTYVSGNWYNYRRM